MRPIFLIICFAALSFMLLSSCDNKLEVQQCYGFSVETMPVPKNVKLRDTIEIRCTLNREGEFEETKYSIRYFQPDGKGTLQNEQGTVFLPNDRYPLGKEVFRLYYISQSDQQQTIDITVEDNFRQRFDFSFSFDHEEGEEGAVTE